MKRGIFIITLALLCALASPVFAMDYIIGAKGGYFTWVPYVKEIKGSGMSAIDKGDGVLYGPVLSLMPTQDISISVAALFGKQSTYWYSPTSIIDNGPGNQAYSSGTYYMTANRIDIDSAISYRVSESFKIFAGFKYQTIEVIFRASERRSGVTPATTEEYSENYAKIEAPAQGPALGFGYTLPLGQSFFMTANLSGLYMWGKFDMIKNYGDTYNVMGGTINTVTRNDHGTMTLDTTQMGFNFEPAVGARIGDSGVIATVGVRVQYMWLDLEYNQNVDTSKKWVNDVLYGLFVSVLYSF
ncbi:MAG: hypothetical protein EPN93_00445 [Spirochaetes bacterium]|nr:MAG: hypothetical protein EPN93_00445 [Spirochaetota bacterium]